MKRPNGTGCVKKLNGRRRKPYQALVTSGKKIVKDRVVQNQVSLGTFETKKEALQALSEQAVNPVNLSLKDTTFKQAYEIVRDKAGWEKNMLNSMNAAFGHCKVIHDMKLPDIRKYELQLVADSLEGKSTSTQNNVSMVVSDVFSYGMEYDIINKDYSKFMEFPEAGVPRERKIYTPEEIKIVESTADIVQKILLYTGMRIAELINMKTSQVKTINGIQFFDDVGTKTIAAKRMIPVHKKISDIVNSNLTGTYLIEPHTTTAKYRNDIYYLIIKNMGLITRLEIFDVLLHPIRKVV